MISHETERQTDIMHNKKKQTTHKNTNNIRLENQIKQTPKMKQKKKSNIKKKNNV